MKQKYLLILATAITFLACYTNYLPAETRPPQVAGAFYPASQAELSQMIDGFLEQVPEQKIAGKLIALIVPHAGYQYSGQVAAYAYKLLQGRRFDTVILIGPSHHAYINVASVWCDGDWETPLGKVPVDTAMAKAIAGENELFSCSVEAHWPEHSLEVQLPFLQKTLKSFKIVPILVSEPTLKNCRSLAGAIVRQMNSGKRVLLVISTDMSHYFPYAKASEMDHTALAVLAKQDAKTLDALMAKGACEFCGSGAVLTALAVADLLAPVKISVLKYANSGDVTGDRDRVVGYSATAIYQEEPTTKKGQNMLSKTQQKELLKIARQTVESYVQTGTVPEFKVTDKGLLEKRGVFVTLHENGELRGCIGYIMPIEALYLAVSKMAVEAATGDPRFSPVKPAELPQLEIEISVLSVPVSINNPEEIVMGTHGVIVRKGGRGGVFLPQVATETGWTREQFLDELCSQKAGLPADAWKNKDCELYTFSAQVFGEKE